MSYHVINVFSRVSYSHLLFTDHDVEITSKRHFCFITNILWFSPHDVFN